MSSQADALRLELARHERQGRTDRVEQIKAELAALGEEETAEARRAEHTTAAKRARRK